MYYNSIKEREELNNFSKKKNQKTQLNYLIFFKKDDGFFDEGESEITAINKEADLISFVDAMIYYDELDPKEDFQKFYNVVFSLMWGLKGTAGFKVDTCVNDEGAYLHILLNFTEEATPKWAEGDDDYSCYGLYLDEFMELMIDQGSHLTGYNDLFLDFPEIRCGIPGSSKVTMKSN